MTEALERARDELKRAEKTADDDAREDIRETAEAYRDYVIGDHQPDQAVVDAHLNTLRQVRERVDDDTKERVEEALEATEDYREGLEQA